MPKGEADPPRRLDATTVVVDSERGGATHRAEPEFDVVVIAWCPTEPHRVGEIAIIPATGGKQVLGRGNVDGEARLRFFRSRPGRMEPAPALASPKLSRRQAEIEPAEAGIEVRRIGQCSMRHNGVERDVALVRSGDTLRFSQELVLLCTRRPARIAPLGHLDAVPAPDFGEPDTVGMLGESPAIWELRHRIVFAARSAAHVLLVGQSGTGKELAAKALYRMSERSGRPFVARNAATLPAGLIDAELFGNVRGYPNPTMVARPGLIGQAEGGFLFLDEIGELPPDLQAHLLRVLDAGEYQRLGEATVRRSDFRLIAATNRDPTELKHDLLARLTMRIECPALSERREDIPLLARHLVLSAAEKSPDVAARFVTHGPDAKVDARIDARLIDELLRRDYAGNVRELEALLWAAMTVSQEDVIAWSEEAIGVAPARSDSASGPRRELTEEEIRAALQKEEGNVTRAAKRLGVSSRYTLYRLMTKLGIEERE